jgi:hypothetical protein
MERSETGRSRATSRRGFLEAINFGFEADAGVDPCTNAILLRPSDILIKPAQSDLFRGYDSVHKLSIFLGFSDIPQPSFDYYGSIVDDRLSLSLLKPAFGLD